MFLQARGRMTAGELAEELEVSERTIYRDLEALNAAGVPVLAERGPGGGCELPENYRTNLTGLSEPEVRGLFLSAVPGPLADLGLGKSIEAAVLKLTASLPAVQRDNIGQMRERIHIDTAEWFRPPEQVPHLDTVQRAVWADRCVAVLYTRSDNGLVRRRLEPYGLVAKAGVWYMVAAMSTLVRPLGVTRVKTARRQLQVYRVSRIVEARVLEEQFERPEWLNLQEYWERWQQEFQDSLPRYATRIRVAPDIVPLLPRLHGEGVRALISNADPPDAHGWIEITLVFQSLEEACISVLGLGASAEVVEPAELHIAVLEAAARVVELYGSHR